MFRKVATSLRRPVAQGWRSFLSETYACNDAWAQSRTSPLPASLNVEEFYQQLDKSVSKSIPISPIDVDVFTHAVTEKHIAELRDLLHKFRLTPNTTSMLDSTPYAAIRAFLDTGNVTELIDILDDRINYGIFLNEFTANMLFNKLLLAEDYASAAKVASFLMLQEDFEGPIAEEFSLYSAYKFLSQVQVEKPAPEPPKPKKKPEEVKIRVQFLRNPYFDDHFDLRDNKQLAGKTLTAITRNRDDPLSLNCRLLGLIYHKKFDQALSLAKMVVDQKILFGEILEISKKLIDSFDEARHAVSLESYKNVISAMEGSTCQNVNIDDALKQRIKDAIAKHEEKDTLRHSQLFDQWKTIRETELKKHIESIEYKNLLEEHANRNTTLKKLEEKIWFFDNEDKVDLKISNRAVDNRKKWDGKKKTRRATLENYVPPDVNSRRR